MAVSVQAGVNALLDMLNVTIDAQKKFVNIYKNDEVIRDKILGDFIHVLSFHYDDFIQILGRDPLASTPLDVYYAHQKMRRSAIVLLLKHYAAYMTSSQTQKCVPFPDDKYVFYFWFFFYIKETPVSMERVCGLIEDEGAIRRFKYALKRHFRVLRDTFFNYDNARKKFKDIIEYVLLYTQNVILVFE